MANFSARSVITKNELPRIGATGKRAASAAVRRAALAIPGYAYPISPFKTNNMRTRFDIKIGSDGLSATTKWLMFYTIYQNEGTRRGIKPKKFAQKAVELVKPGFESACRAAFGGGSIV